MIKPAWGVWLVSTCVACGAAPPPPAAPPPAPRAPSTVEAPPPPVPRVDAPPPDPFVLRGALREETLAASAYTPLTAPLAAPPKGLAAPPAACGAFLARKKSAKRACEPNGAPPAALEALDAALGEADAAKRDGLLASLEGCSALPAGFVRALRAELAPTACGDALVAPALASPGVSPELQHALYGLAIAARLARAVEKAPVLAPPYDKDRVLAFIRGPVKDWMTTQAALTQDLSQQAAHVMGYGMAVSAVEAGTADLRLVDAMRAVPVPDTFAKDAELRAAYEAALDQMLEPRKDRGRDAALAGLKQLAALGVVTDERVARARALLGKLYAGRRIDALDALLLPPLPAPGASPDVNHRLAARLPTFYAQVLLDPQAITDKDGLAVMIPRGVPTGVRARLKSESASDEVRVLVAQEHLYMARAHWRAVDVDEAAAAARSAGDAKGRTPEDEVLLALAIALRGGPEDAAQMMRRPPADAIGIGHVAALDAVAAKSGPFAGLAAFDAAWIKRVGAPRDAGAAYWKDVAARFRAAEGALGDAASKARAADAAREADAIAAAAN